MNTKLIASMTLAAFAGVSAAQAGQLADELHRDHQRANQAANASGKKALQAAGKALEPVIYAGKAVINGAEFVILKTVSGTIMVAEAAVRGIEFAYEGAKFLALKTKEGVIWVAEKAVQAGEIILDAAVTAIEITVDGVIYVAQRLEEGVVFVAKKAVEAARKTGELVVRGAKFVAKKTKQGVVWVAKTTMNAIRAGKRAALVVEIRTNLTTALAAGNVSDNTMAYFARRSQHKDPVIAKLGAACLQASQAFNAALE